jgi:two-component system response regulator YesN
MNYGISGISTHKINSAFKESLIALTSLFFNSNRCIQFYSRLESDIKTEDRTITFEEIIKKSSRYMEIGDYSSVNNVLKELHTIYNRENYNWDKISIELDEIKHIIIHHGIMNDKFEMVDKLRVLNIENNLKLEDVVVKLQEAIEAFSKESLLHIKYETGSITNEIIQYIKLNYASRVGLENISQHVNRNNSYVSRIFKNETSVTITEFLNHVRIREAKKLLVTTDLKIYNISELVGYRNLDSFHIQFKKNTEMSPNKYRKQYNI